MNIKLLLVVVTAFAATASHAEQLRREAGTRRATRVVVPSNADCISSEASQTTLSLCMESLIAYMESEQLRALTEAAFSHTADAGIEATRYALAGRAVKQRAEAVNRSMVIPLNGAALGDARVAAGEIYRDGMTHHVAAQQAAAAAPGSAERATSLSIMRGISESGGSAASYGEAAIRMAARPTRSAATRMRTRAVPEGEHLRTMDSIRRPNDD